MNIEEAKEYLRGSARNEMAYHPARIAVDAVLKDLEQKTEALKNIGDLLFEDGWVNAHSSPVQYVKNIIHYKNNYSKNNEKLRMELRSTERELDSANLILTGTLEVLGKVKEDCEHQKQLAEYLQKSKQKYVGYLRDISRALGNGDSLWNAGEFAGKIVDLSKQVEAGQREIESLRTELARRNAPFSALNEFLSGRTPVLPGAPYVIDEIIEQVKRADAETETLKANNESLQAERRTLLTDLETRQERAVGWRMRYEEQTQRVKQLTDKFTELDSRFIKLQERHQNQAVTITAYQESEKRLEEENKQLKVAHSRLSASQDALQTLHRIDAKIMYALGDVDGNTVEERVNSLLKHHRFNIGDAIYIRTSPSISVTQDGKLPDFPTFVRARVVSEEDFQKLKYKQPAMLEIRRTLGLEGKVDDASVIKEIKWLQSSRNHYKTVAENRRKHTEQALTTLGLYAVETLRSKRLPGFIQERLQTLRSTVDLAVKRADKVQAERFREGKQLFDALVKAGVKMKPGDSIYAHAVRIIGFYGEFIHHITRFNRPNSFLTWLPSV